jgi:hypothetical protein
VPPGVSAAPATSAKAELGSEDAVVGAGGDANDEAATSPLGSSAAPRSGAAEQPGSGGTKPAAEAVSRPQEHAPPSDAPASAESAEGSSGMPPVSSAAQGGAAGGGFSFGGNLAKSVGGFGGGGGSGFGALAGEILKLPFSNRTIRQQGSEGHWARSISALSACLLVVNPCRRWMLHAGAASSSGGFAAFGSRPGTAEANPGGGGLFGSNPAFAFGASADADASTPTQSMFGGAGAGESMPGWHRTLIEMTVVEHTQEAGVAPARAAAGCATCHLMRVCAMLAGSAQDGPAAGKPAVLAAAEKVETGEEGERTVFAGDGTLFSFDTAGWRERGRGELRVKVDRSGAPFPRTVSAICL